MNTETKHCCVNCFSEPEIIKFVHDSSLIGDCDYCGGKNLCVRDVNEVAEFIKQGVERYYEDVVHHGTHVSAEGGYTSKTLGMQEILNYELEIFSDSLDDPSELAQDLAHGSWTPYVRKNPHGPDSGLEQFETWNEFCDLVKKEQRFTAFLTSNERLHDESHPHNFLNGIAHTINESLISILDVGTKIYRARIFTEGLDLNHEDLTSPEPRKTKNSRMSPAGISFFYGSLDPNTCIAEVRPTVGEKVVVAEFEVLEDLKIVNLSNDFEEPLSIFNENFSFYYEEYVKPFFSNFVVDISNPIRPTDTEIDYVPTQIFTEFIKMHQFQCQEQLYFFNIFNPTTSNSQQPSVFRVRGLLFKSSIKNNGTNVAFFKGPDISTEERVPGSEAWLLYTGFKIYEIKEIQFGCIETSIV